MPKISKEPQYLSVMSKASPIGVDRENKRINGYVVAEMGVFKDYRGQFDRASLQQIVAAWPGKGLRSRFGHPNLSSDGIGKYLGRAVNPRVDGNVVRADLVFAQRAYSGPDGSNYADYIMDSVEEDPESMGTSLVLIPKRMAVLDDKGNQKYAEDGEPVPDIWHIDQLMASDVVDTGAATSSMLSMDINEHELPDAVVREVTAALNGMFADLSHDVVQCRLIGFVEKYLHNRYGKGINDPRDKLIQLYSKQLNRLLAHRN